MTGVQTCALPIYFFANQNLYLSPSNAPAASAPATLFTQLVTYSSNPANIPAAKAAYWATASEMVWNKTNDLVYPGYVGAALPQTP